MAMHIDHVVLWVEDGRRAVEFYERVVGLTGVRVAEFLEGKVPFASMRISETSILDLTPAFVAAFAAGMTGEKIPTAAGKPINHVCLAMDRADFDALAARLDAAGVARHRVGERSFGAKGSSKHWFYFQDPDGNVLEARHYEDDGAG
jgi:catechol 2,3-dioxygenase-like lactoylglutathione lyase family enzyme